MADSLERHQKLVEWIISLGGHISDRVELAYDSEKGFFIRVKPSTKIFRDTNIARCPVGATLSYLNVLDAPEFPCHGTKFPSKFLRSGAFKTQCFFLIDQYLYGSKSYWYPYFQTLPSPPELGTHAPFNEADLEYLEGTNLAAGLQRQLSEWREAYESGLAELASLDWPAAANGSYTWPLFVWAAAVFSTRSFSSAVLANTLAADIARPHGADLERHVELSEAFSEGFAVLIPILDLLNYRPITQVEWQAGFSNVSLKVLEDLQSGQEVCNNYGPKDNERLLLGYGFAIESNPFDHYAVGFKVPPDSPLQVVRTVLQAQRQSQGLPPKHGKDYEYFIFNPDHPRVGESSILERALFSADLFDSISILCGNRSELRSSTFKRYHSFLTPVAGERFGRNFLNTLAQLLIECEARLSRLQTTSPLSRGQKPQNSMQNHARIYREGQTRILELATDVCRRSLNHARGIEIDPGTSSHQEFFGRYQTLAVAGELLNFDKLLEELPKTLTTYIRPAADTVVDEAKKCLGRGPKDQFFFDKLRYTVAVAIMRLAEENKDISQRAQSWMSLIRQWYNRDTVEVEASAEDFLESLDAIMNADTCDAEAKDTFAALGELVGHNGEWWGTGLVCWSWEVVQEESVLISGEAYLLYVPQLDV
ncbi:MAG: hypothetical protein Q9227_002631 [Pyrenula ochraceoflavens]